MNFPKTIEKFFSNRKYHFWFGHTLFWIFALLESSIIEPDAVESLKAFLLLVIIIALGFLLTYFLRLIYKVFLGYGLNILPLVALVLIYSIIAGLIWTYSVIILSHYFTGNSIKLPPYFLMRMASANYTYVFLWSCLYLGYKIWEGWNDQKYQLEHERALLRTSQLEMLKYQLNPHFLFNTLSSLRGLINVDPTKAREMVTQISEFLRYSLLEGKNNEVQLIKEIEIIKQYLNIEQVRYDEDLILEYDISPETKDLMIPIFLVHPLVENAVKHGMQTSQLPLIISIRSEIIDRNLQIEVGNSGHWIENENKGGTNNSGIGLINIQKRLEHSYPGKHSFKIIKDPEFVKVVIKINYSEHGQIN